VGKFAIMPLSAIRAATGEFATLQGRYVFLSHDDRSFASEARISRARLRAHH